MFMADLGRAKSKSPEKKASLFSCPASVSCSVCLEYVTDAGERSIAKLKCGHHFHLDCIGSAFNAKGSMQCPNCRCVEEGRWLYANGCHHFEDYAVDGLPYEDDYEVYAGIVDLFQPHEELLNHLHWSASPSSSHQHVSVTLEEGDSPASVYPDIVVNVLYDELGGSSNSVHACPYLASQMGHYPRPMQYMNSSAGVSRNHEVTPPILSPRRVGAGSIRTARVSVSDRNTWGSHVIGPLLSTNSAVNADYAEVPLLTHEGLRRSRAVTGHSAHGNHDSVFAHARFHRRMPGSSAGSSEAPSVTPYGHNQRLVEPLNPLQHAPSSTLRHRLTGTNRRARYRGAPAAFPGESSNFRQSGPGASWNTASRVGGNYAGGLSSLDGMGWTDESQDHWLQRNSYYANQLTNAPFANRQPGAHFENLWGYDPESLWRPWFQNGGISQSYDDVAATGYQENDFFGGDGQFQTELVIPSEEHLAGRGHGGW